MPYPVADNNCFRVTVFTSQGEQVATSSFLIQASVVGAVTVYDTEVAEYISGAFAALFKPLLQNEAQYDGVSVRRTVGGGDQPRTVWSNDGFGAGTAGAEGLARQTAGLIQLLTPRAGKAYRGRMYLPFPAEADNEGAGAPTVGYGTKLVAVGDWMVAGHTVPGTVGNITISAGLMGAVFGEFYRYDGFRTYRRWATQRRRGSFGQANTNPF